MALGPLLLSAALWRYTPASAAPQRPRAYGVAAVALSHHPADAQHYRSFITSVGGNGWDVSGGGGVRLSGALDIEGEFVYGGTIATPQFTFLTEQARDTLLNGLLRYHAASTPRVSLVAGGGYSWTQTSEEPAQGFASSHMVARRDPHRRHGRRRPRRRSRRPRAIVPRPLGQTGRRAGRLEWTWRLHLPDR